MEKKNRGKQMMFKRKEGCNMERTEIAETEKLLEEEPGFEYLHSVAGSRRITKYILDIGEMILAAGGEAGRVEDTICRMGAAYGFRKVDVFTITSCIFVTVTDAAGNTFTQTRRVRQVSTDMERVRMCNELSREICRVPLPEAALKLETEKLLKTKTYHGALRYLGYILIAASMAVFFGGNFMDLIAAALAAPVELYVLDVGKKVQIQNFVVYFLDAFIVGLLIYLLLKFGIGQNYDKIAMGNIMPLIPGAGLTTAVRDMINGDIMTGIMGFMNALLQAAAIALGFVAAFIIFEG